MLDETTAGDTVGEKTYRRLRTDIVFGRLLPGERLTLDRMRDTYAASVSTLREVLSRLSSEGLIIAEGARGFGVMPISSRNLREIAAMRCLLESHALRQSFEHGDMEWEGAVVAAHHKLAAMERRMASGDTEIAESWKRYDREFHGTLVSACGSRVLLDAHGAIYDLFLRYQMLATVYRGEAASAEHQRLLDCALARDWAAAQATLAQHVDDCVEHMIAKRFLS